MMLFPTAVFRNSKALISVSLVCFALLSVPASRAQEPAKPNTPDVSARKVIEVDKATAELVEEKNVSDSQGIESLSTPLNALLGLRNAMRTGDHDRLGDFLDRRYLPEEMEQYSSEDLLKALTYVFSQQNILDLTEVSDDPRGSLKDGLPDYREQIGTVVISTGDVPIYLQRVPDGKGGREWKLSNATVAKIPEMWDELGYSPVAEYLHKHLPDVKFMGMDNWQLMATLLAFAVAWPMATLASYILKRLALMIPNHFPMGIQRFFRVPMRFFLFLYIARVIIDQLGLSLTARILLESSGMGYVAWTILLLGLMSLVRDYQIRKLQMAGNSQYMALLRPFTSILKVIAVAIIALVWAHDAGYNMSTILAGLGVGSLAVALAAQKTLENVIGAATLYAARPVSAGDFCRFGTILGTVEEIGLRSTVIRTLDRSLVAIPNSVFASQQVENFTHRDHIRYYRKFKLQLVGADQLRLILAEVKKLLLSHPEVLQESVSVRFETIVDATAVLRLDGLVNTTDFQAFLAVAEDLNLRIVDAVHAAGGLFSGPGQLVQLRELPPDSPEQSAQIEATLKQWQEQDKFPFPNYSAEEIVALKGSLDYPPRGSSA